MERTFSIARHVSRYNRLYALWTFAAILIARHRQRRNALRHAEAEDAVFLLPDIDRQLAVAEYKERLEEVNEVINVDGISDTNDYGPRLSSLRMLYKGKGKDVRVRSPKAPLPRD